MPRRTAVVLSLCVALMAIPGLLSAYMLWSGIYQINPALDEWFRDAVPVLGGDWVVVGTIGSNLPTVPPEIRITRIDETGAVLWDKHVTGDPQHPDFGNYARGVAASPDGGCVTVAEIVVAGGIGDVDVLVTKWSSNGTVQWHRLIGMVGREYQFYIAPAKFGGYVVAGISILDDVYVLNLFKLSEDGTPEWQKQFGDEDDAISIQGYSSLEATADGGCVILAWVNHTTALTQYNLVVKLGIDGSVEWMREIGEDDQIGSPNYLSSVSQDPTGGYILVGQFVSSDTRLWLLRLHGSGIIDWQKTLTEGGFARGFGAVGIDDGYLVTGIAAGNNWFVRTYLDGAIRWVRSYDFAAGPTLATDIVLGPGETFVATGRDYRSTGGWFLRAPISSGIVPPPGCPVSDTNYTEDLSVDNIAEFVSTIPVDSGSMDIDYSPAVTVSNLTANRQIDCSEVNDEEFVMGDDFEGGDFDGWSDVFE